MGLWSRLFGPASKVKAGPQETLSVKSPAGEALAQRQALAAKLLTPERQTRLAEAMQVQAAKQRLQRSLKSDLGQQQTAEALRRLLDKS